MLNVCRCWTNRQISKKMNSYHVKNGMTLKTNMKAVGRKQIWKAMTVLSVKENDHTLTSPRWKLEQNN